jgi:phosphatidylinositol 4-phosphatase
MGFFQFLRADSGDAISLLYAGTRALKADVTRTGKRQWIKGSLDDGLNSLTRYYLNNFSDGRKQDGYDLWSGKVAPESLDSLVQTEGLKRARQVYV